MIYTHYRRFLLSRVWSSLNDNLLLLRIASLNAKLLIHLRACIRHHQNRWRVHSFEIGSILSMRTHSWTTNRFIIRCPLGSWSISKIVCDNKIWKWKKYRNLKIQHFTLDIKHSKEIFCNSYQQKKKTAK